MSNDQNQTIYAIREASQMIGLEPSVLRYWESQFPQLSPGKDDTGARVYTDEDILLLIKIKHLLKEEHYTIKGARQKMDAATHDIKVQNASVNQLLEIRRFLSNLLQNL